ncbi:MAG: hypothetical protein K0R50_2698 [Eubacterium sp.]|jgi:hypothetical protein|nr:hypothetical protein [Eubacterium sp.]
MDFVAGKANFRSNNCFIARKFNVEWRKIRQNDKCNEILNRLQITNDKIYNYK